MSFKISIVTSLYKSDSYIENFYRLYKEELLKITDSYEFVFVDDGCPHESYKIAAQIAKIDSNVKLIRLSRNFGQHIAMYAGMQNASGDLIFTSDCDLEEEPSALGIFFRMLKESHDCDVIFGYTEDRDGGLFRGILGGLFYHILSYMSDTYIHPSQTWQRLMKKKYVEELLRFSESDSMPVGLMALTGFKQIPVMTEKKYKGSSSYTIKKRLKLALNAILSMSSKPLVLIATAGFFITFVSSIYILYLLLHYFSGQTYMTGWISIFASLWFICGLILTSLGLIGIYISKIFMSVKQRPKYIVKEIISFS